MAFGYRGKMLEIDLSQRKSKIFELPENELLKFTGGAGHNAWLLYQNLTPSVQALDPGNPLIFGTGPLVGTPFPTASRSTFTALSPLTGIFGDSNGGGFLGVMVKRSGYDHIMIKGASDKPCYLLLGPDGVCTIEDAGNLWGKDTLTTQKILKAQYPNAAVATIGPAGENLVRYACIMSNNNANSFSQTGMGAVMGSKKLKAVVVLGSNKIMIKDPILLKEVSDSVKQWTQDLAFPKLFRKYGTAMFINPVVAQGLIYANNGRCKVAYEDITSLDIGAYYEATESKDHGCYRCPLKCGKHWSIKEGQFKGEKGYGYEVAYIMSLGLTLGIRDVPSILHLVNKLNLLGIDIKEFAGTVGMAIDAGKQGSLDKKTMEELELNWGTVKAMETVAEKVARRQGIGNILAEGTRSAAEKIGGNASRYALHMKGMHWPGNSAPPYVLAFTVSTRGGDFLKAIPHLLAQSNDKIIAQELFGATPQTFDTSSHTAKGRAVWWHENYKLINDNIGTCFYLSQTLLSHGNWLPEHIAEAVRAATGFDVDGKDLLIAAERGYQIERTINILRGMEKEPDTFTKRPEPDSWAEGIDIKKPGMLDEYYAYHGLSLEGLLTRKRLHDLDLDQVGDDLEKQHKLGTFQNMTDYLPLSTIIKNPSGEKFGKSIKAGLQNRIRNRVMAKMAEKPSCLQKHWRTVHQIQRIKGILF